MTGQLSLNYPYEPAAAAAEVWKRRLEAIRVAVHHLGLKSVAAECDVAPSTMSDALNERDRKRFAGEWIDVVLAMLDRASAVHLALPILEHQAALVRGVEVKFKPAHRDPKEELALMREVLSAQAPGLIRIVDDEIRRRA